MYVLVATYDSYAYGQLTIAGLRLVKVYDTWIFTHVNILDNSQFMQVANVTRSVLSAHQLISTFCLYVKAALMHYTETPST